MPFYEKKNLGRQTSEKQNMLQRPAAVALLAALCCALWGSAYPGIKTGYRLFAIASDASADQIIFAGSRFALAGILVIISGSLLEKRILLPKRSSWKKIALISLTQTVIQYIFFYLGLAHTTGVRSSIISGTSTFIAVLIACLFLRQEKLTVRKVIGCILGFSGVVLINTGGASGAAFALNGEGFIFFSTIAYAISSNLIRIYSQDEDPVMLCGYQFFSGGIVMVVTGLLFGGHFHAFTPAGAGIFLYLGFLSAAAYSIWSILLKNNPVSSVTVYSFLIPVFGVILSILFLNEQKETGLKSFLALILVCIGVYIVNGKAKTAEKRV